MATYLILNLVFMVAVVSLLRPQPIKPDRNIVKTLVVLIILTAIFDNLIVGLSIVDYDPSKILGLKIGYAPVEDFMYAILAAIMIPSFWHSLGAKNAK